MVQFPVKFGWVNTWVSDDGYRKPLSPLFSQKKRP
jgi:hypothetical protein